MTIDSNVRIPVAAKDRFAKAAEGEGMSLRAYLTRLADAVVTPQERAERVRETRRVLKAWNGFDPTPTEEAQLDGELDKRLAAAGIENW